MKERKQWAEEFAQIKILTGEDGAELTLGEIAEVRDGFEECGFHSQFNEQPSVEIEIFRVGRQSPLDIEKTVQRVMDTFAATAPEGVQLRIDSNRSQDFRERLSLLLNNGLMAIFIVLAILSLFLEFRLAFWVMMGMTISFVGGIIFLPMLGVSINMVSMFAFLIVLDIVVDLSHTDIDTLEKATEAFSSINRRNGRRVVSVGMDVEPKREVGQIIEAIRKTEMPQMQADFPGLTYTFEGSQSDMRESTQALKGGSCSQCW